MILILGIIIISVALFRIIMELKDISESLYKISKHLESIDKKMKTDYGLYYL